VYVRHSLDSTGERLGVERQRNGCVTKAETLGWTVVGVYEDNHLSASTTRLRPAYERLLTHLEQGVVDAVIVGDLDRLHRHAMT
jgi:DNA invertase Pin-like site-specific DNA recombinase